MRNDRFVSAISDVLLDEGVEKLDRGADGGGFVARDREVDRNDFGALVEDLIVSLAQEFGDTGRRLHQQQQAATCVGRLGLGHDAIQFAGTTDKVLLDHAAEDAAKVFAGLRLLMICSYSQSRHPRDLTQIRCRELDR